MRVGKSVPAVSNTIRLLSLPDALKDALVPGVITEGHVRPLLSLGDAKLMLDVFKRILRDNYTVRQTEELARRVKGEVQQKEPASIKDQMYIPEQDQYAMEIKEKLVADNVRIQQSGRKASVVIEVNGKPEETTEKIKAIHRALTQ